MKVSDQIRRSPAVDSISIIERVIALLEISPAEYAAVEKSYNAIAEILQKPGSPLTLRSPEIRPQGSIRIGTTITPWGTQRFDLDMLCNLRASSAFDPSAVYEWVWDALGQDETYRKMRIRMNRCIRLEYAESRKFYLDVTPSIPADSGFGSNLFVPDRMLEKWCISNPIAFADDWFLPAAKRLPQINVSLRAANTRETVMASAEPLPEHGGFLKTPLQRIVQVMKRNRDEFFQDDQAHRPSSILLTTLATHAYLETLGEPTGSLFDFIVKVAQKVPNGIQSRGEGEKRKFEVKNPVSPTENFAEKWGEDHYQRFLSWHRSLMSWLRSIGDAGSPGIHVILNRLSEGLGKDVVIKAANAIGADTDALHQSGRLSVVRPSIGSAAAVIAPKTTYFGKPE